APTAVGLLGTWAATVLLTEGLVAEVREDDALPYGVALGVLGVGWAVVSLAGLVRERMLVLALGAGTALAGAQLTGVESPETQYLSTAALAVAGFVLYARERSWPLVALGVAGVTLAVPEAVSDWTDDDLGVAGGVLVAGVSLLVASAFGLRLRATTESPPDDGPAPP
ncbi:MAG: hypothetical protein ACRDYU_03925, partial [Actinomycetes bacterium]